VPRSFSSRGLGSSAFLVIYLALAGCTGGWSTTGGRLDPGSMAPTELEGKDLVVLQSDLSPAFTGVTEAIAKKLKGGFPVFTLKQNAKADAALVRQLRAHNGRIVVAVGLEAALIARKLRGAKVVFCQVFNYMDFDLLTPWMKGVSAIPPFKQQLQVWKKLDPDLNSVGMITGPGLADLVAEAQAAASANGVEIKHVQVRSDLETLYAFKQLSPDIRGLWLLPDNRVLSRSTLRDLLSYSRKQGKQVAVFSEQLLPVGGLISFESDYGDIADRVIARSKHALHVDALVVPGPPMLPLTRIDFKINPLAVKQLGLRFPPELRNTAHVQ